MFRLFLMPNEADAGWVFASWIGRYDTKTGLRCQIQKQAFRFCKHKKGGFCFEERRIFSIFVIIMGRPAAWRTQPPETILTWKKTTCNYSSFFLRHCCCRVRAATESMKSAFRNVRKTSGATSSIRNCAPVSMATTTWRCTLPRPMTPTPDRLNRSTSL